MKSKWSPYQRAGGHGILIGPDVMNLAIGKMDHSIGHISHHGIMRDDHGQRAQFAIQRLGHNAVAEVQPLRKPETRESPSA